MKRIARFLVACTLILGCFGFMAQAQALNLSPVSFTSASTFVAKLNEADKKLTTEFGQKIDLNNSNIREFRELRGFYPNLASKIIKNAPYDNVEDVLSIPGLSDRQKDRLQANLESFTVTPPAKEFIEGDDRVNPGVY